MSIVTLDQMKAHLCVTFPDDDALIQSKVDAAEEWISTFCILVDPCDPDSTSIAMWPPNPVPLGIIEAIKLLAAHLYENREASLIGITSSELPFGFWGLLSPYRSWAF